MNLIVSDTSPLNLLIRIGQDRVLPIMFQRIIIPGEVAAEMRHPKAPDIVRRFIASPPAWLAIEEPARLLALPELDPGEVAAISLAVELRAVLMVDEHDGRTIAMAHGLQIVGAIGVLERAAILGHIGDLDAVHCLIRSLRFHVSERILAASLRRVQEQKRSGSEPAQPGADRPGEVSP